MIRTIERLTEDGVLLRLLREGIDYSTSTGRMLAGVFAALAEYERELIHERAAAARAAARLRGRHTGRPPRLTPTQTRQVRSLRTGGESINELVRTFGVSRATIYRALRATEQAKPRSWPPSRPAPSTTVQLGAPGTAGDRRHTTLAQNEAMYPSVVTAQDGELPQTTGGWVALASYATALVLITGVVTWRRTHPAHVADRATAEQAAARWSLHHDSGDRYTLTNQRDDDARNVSLATTPRRRPWLATALGIRTPAPATPVRIAGHHTAAANVSGGHSISINLHNHRPHGWLEIDWTQPDDAPAWAKYPTTGAD